MHRPTVSEIEAGRRAVTSEELYSFAQLYAVSVSALLSDPIPQTDHVTEVLFRRQGLDTPTAKTAVLLFIERCRAERELEEALGLEHSVDTRPGYRADPPSNKWEAVQQGARIADQERQRLAIGNEPIRTPLDLLEKQGVRIGPITALDDDQIDGLYFESADLGPCVGVNPNRDEWTGFRSSFTAAHEYAHWLLQDVRVELFEFRPGTEDLSEVRANSFAAAFLMPEGGIRDHFAGHGLLKNKAIWHLSPGDVVRAMDHFGVSRQALLYRLQNLTLITERTAESLRTFRIRDTARLLEITFGATRYIGTRLPTLAIHAWRRGVIAASRAAELCGIDLQDFKHLVGQLGEQPEAYEGTPLLGAAS
jgi:Zn-dependent peptidase ImmA (M78 family)